MSDANTVLAQIKDGEFAYVDLRFTDPRGKWQHLAMDSTVIDEDTFSDGIMFDGSSISGWKVINESDMTLMPDPTSAVEDPFLAQRTLVLFCDVLEPSTGEAYARCPRSVAKRAEAFLAASGVGDTAYFGPEAEFFVFDDVRYNTAPNEMAYSIDEGEGPATRDRIVATLHPDLCIRSVVLECDMVAITPSNELRPVIGRRQQRVLPHRPDVAVEEVADLQHEVVLLGHVVLDTVDRPTSYRRIDARIAGPARC